MGLNLNWLKMQTFLFPIFCNFAKKIIYFFAFCVIIFGRIFGPILSSVQEDFLNLSFVNNNHIVGTKWPGMVKKQQLGHAGGGGYHRQPPCHRR